MSKQSLILCVATLAAAMTLPAQVTNEVPPKKTSSKTVEVKYTSSSAGQKERRDLILEPGTLQQVVGQLESYYRQHKTEGDTMPILVWGTDVQNLRVPAPLRLADVKAVDALALVAASAGCALEPIESPQQGKGKVIGYKFVRPENNGWPMAGSGGSGTTTVYTSKGAAMGAVPGFPGASGGAGGFPGGGMGGGGGVSSGNKTVTASPGAGMGAGSGAGGIKEMEERLLRFQQTLNDEHPRVVELKREMEVAKKIALERPLTRVYAMGGIITGNNVEQEAKLDRIKNSISQTLNEDEIDVKSVKVSYHDGTNVLVVRAPEAAQELVGQLIEALRENAKAVNSKP